MESRKSLRDPLERAKHQSWENCRVSLGHCPYVREAGWTLMDKGKSQLLTVTLKGQSEELDINGVVGVCASF